MARLVAATLLTSTPRVTVVVPCYNYGHFLPDCVHSILAQPGIEPDVVIVDDASPDGSSQVALALADQHEQVRVILHQTNRGHIATYNDGLATAEGDFVVLISADDLLAPGALSRASAVMTQFPDVGLVYGNPIVFTGTPPAECASKVRNWTIWTGPQWAALQCRRGTSLITSPESVLRTSVQHRIGYYRPELPHSGDLEMWLRVAAVADVARVNGPDQAFKRMHTSNMITTKFSSFASDLEERRKAYEMFFDGSGRQLAHVDRLRRASSRRLAAEALDWVCSRYADGDVEASNVQATIDFAQEIYPDYQKLGVWRELQWRRNRSGQGRRRDAALSAVLDARRDLVSRAAWHRWHRYGS